MNPTEIAKFLQDLHRLPSLSTVVLELLSTLNHEDVDSELLVAKIGQDQVLAARTLKLANSSFYGMTVPVATIQDAVSILGRRAIRRLASSAALMVVFPLKSQAGFDAQALWRHAVATAIFAGELARLIRSDEDTAYVAGLLHDVGRLALATQFPDAYAQAMAYRMERTCTVTMAETAILGIDHADAGAALIDHWHLAPSLQQAVAAHHRDVTPDSALLSVIVCTANTLAHALDPEDGSGPVELAVPATTLQRLGVSNIALNAVLEKAALQLAAASGAIDD